MPLVAVMLASGPENDHGGALPAAPQGLDYDSDGIGCEPIWAREVEQPGERIERAWERRPSRRMNVHVHVRAHAKEFAMSRPPAFLRFADHPEPVATAPAFDPHIGPHLAAALSVTLEALQAAICRSRKGETAAKKLGLTPVALERGLCADWRWATPAGVWLPRPSEVHITPKGNVCTFWSGHDWYRLTDQGDFATPSAMPSTRPVPSASAAAPSHPASEESR